MRQISCNHFGKTSMGKKVPDNIICGKPKRLIRRGIEVSDFTILLKISPTPISRKSITYVPDLPGCITTGETVEETRTEIRAAIPTS